VSQYQEQIPLAQKCKLIFIIKASPLPLVVKWVLSQRALNMVVKAHGRPQAVFCKN